MSQWGRVWQAKTMKQVVKLNEMRHLMAIFCNRFAIFGHGFSVRIWWILQVISSLLHYLYVDRLFVFVIMHRVFFKGQYIVLFAVQAAGEMSSLTPQRCRATRHTLGTEEVWYVRGREDQWGVLAVDVNRSTWASSDGVLLQNGSAVAKHGRIAAPVPDTMRVSLSVVSIRVMGSLGRAGRWCASFANGQFPPLSGPVLVTNLFFLFSRYSLLCLALFSTTD